MSLRKVVGIWLVLLGLMIGNGAVRVLLLRSWLGEALSDVVSAGLGVGIILVTTWLFLSHSRPLGSGAVLRISGWWLFLTVLFETLFGRYGSDRSWAEIAADYEIWNGSLWPIVLLAIAIAPFLWVPRTDELFTRRVPT